MDDVFNNENESFKQETQLMENEYSINLSTKFYYKGNGIKAGLILSIHLEQPLFWGHPAQVNLMRLSTIT